MLSRHARGVFILLITLILTVPPVYAALHYGPFLCKQPGFQCYRVRGGQSWRSMFPDDHDRSIAMRVNRMNTQVWAGMVIAVPVNISRSDIMDYSPFPLHVNPQKEKLVVVDPRVQAWGAYNSDGSLVRWGPASAGSDYCRDIDDQCHTTPGAFRVFSLGSSDCYSTQFPLPDGGAPMPYCMYFSEGQALHGEPNGLPGFNASHGCVRMYVNDAEWLRYEFIEGPDANNNYRGTKVLVMDY